MTVLDPKTYQTLIVEPGPPGVLVVTLNRLLTGDIVAADAPATGLVSAVLAQRGPRARRPVNRVEDRPILTASGGQ